MNTFVAHPNADGLVRLSGTIRNLKVTRRMASFFFTRKDESKFGVIAVAAALAGMDGQAGAAIHSASDMEESADYLEFELDGLPVKGWVWRSTFKEGDQVLVAAQKTSEHWETYGIARPADRLVALYPHCSRGRLAHYKNAFKWSIQGGGGIMIVIFLPLAYYGFGDLLFVRPEPWWVMGGIFACFGVMAISMTRKWMPFVRVAEKVFKALDLPNPSRVDLVKSSKQRKTTKDGGEYGVFYFRY